MAKARDVNAACRPVLRIGTLLALALLKDIRVGYLPNTKLHDITALGTLGLPCFRDGGAEDSLHCTLWRGPITAHGVHRLVGLVKRFECQPER